MEVFVLLVRNCVDVSHDEGLVGAGVSAQVAASAVEFADLDGLVEATFDPLGLDVLVAFGRIFGFAFVEQEWPDDGVGTDQRTVVALRAVALDPYGHFWRDIALDLPGGAQLEVASRVERGYRKLLSLHVDHHVFSFADIIGHWYASFSATVFY